MTEPDGISLWIFLSTRIALSGIREEASPRSTLHMGKWMASEGLQGAEGAGKICLLLSYSLLLSPYPCFRHPPGLGDLYS